MENQADSTPKSQKATPNPTLRIDAEANHLLEVAAKKVGLNKGQYASAAIKHFAKLGLDPSADVAQGLHVVGSKVSQEARAIREQNVAIGNRVISLMNGFEQSLYAYLQEQQDSTLSYLEHIERNLLFQQDSLETNLLAPLVEHVIGGRAEALMARRMSAASRIKIQEALNVPTDDLEALKKSYDYKCKVILTNQLRIFVEANKKPEPLPTPKPTLTPVPAKAVAAVPTPSTTPSK
jgi:hypothetical protein